MLSVEPRTPGLSYQCCAAPNGVLGTQTRVFSGERLKYSVPPAQCTKRIVRVGGCPKLSGRELAGVVVLILGFSHHQNA